MLMCIDTVVKNPLQCRRFGFNLWAWKIPWEEEVATHSSNLAQKILWTEGLVGYHSWGCKGVEHD